MPAKGAQAALKGYRLQALYILWAMLNETNPQMVFQPEGAEDLSIYDDKRLIKSIQIKAHTSNLSLASFSPQDDGSFFHRCVNHKKTGAQIRVVSFGPIGPEIVHAWKRPGNERESITSKFHQFGFNNDDIAFFFADLQWHTVQEDDLQGEILSFLKDSLIGGDPESAFDLLIYWVY